MLSCMADRRSRPRCDVGTTKGADSVLMAETNWSAACGSGCEEAEGYDGDPIVAAVGVGAGVDDDRVEQVRSEALRQPVQVNRVP